MTPITHSSNNTDRFSIISIVVVISVIFITIGLLGFYQIRGNRLVNEAILSLENRAKNVANGIETYLISAQQLAQSTSALIAPQRENSQNVEVLLERILLSAPKETIYGIGAWFEPYVFSPTERYFGPYVHRGAAISDPPVLTYEWTTPEYNFHQQAWYLAGKNAGGQPVFTEPYFDTDLVYMSASQGFYDRDNQFAGVVTVDMVLPMLRNYISNTNLNLNGIIYVTTAKEAIFVHPYEKMLLELALERGKTPTSILDLTTEDLIPFNQQHQSSEWVEVSAKVDYVGWTVYVSVDKRYQFNALNNLRNIIFSVIGTLWVVLVIGLFSLFRISALDRQAREETRKLKTQVLKHQQAQEILQKLNEELEIRENQLTQFLEAMPVGVGILDKNGHVYFFNKKAQELLGKGVVSSTASEQLSSVYQAYLANTSQHYPHDRMPIVRALQGQTSYIDDMEIHQPNKIIPIEAWGSPIFDDQQQVIYAITAFQDITRRKQAQAERERFTEQLQKLNQAYERFVPNQFLNLLDKKSVLEVQLGDQVAKEMTILFSDIRGFTSLSEKMTPQQNFNFINAYLSQMEPVIHQHHGVIDKYIGDAIMALFPTSADDAVRGAIGMLTQLAQYNKRRQLEESPPILIGIGLNTGPLMLGTIGGQDRMDSTVISDAVNLASRIESLTKIYGTPLLITEQTYLKLDDPLQYHIRVIDAVKIKGKSEIITVYEIYDAESPEALALKDMTRNEFEEGFVLYHWEEFNDALPFFERVLQVNEHDQAAQIYRKRCQYFQEHGIPADWENGDIL
jgi:PAS domain S-box-containing protein